MPIIAAAGVFVALALVAYATLVEVDARSSVKASLRHLDSYESDLSIDERTRELSTSLGERTVAPVFSGLLGLARRFTPVGYITGVRKKLHAAGLQGEHELDRFLAIRVLTVLAIPAWAVLIFGVLPLGSGKMPLLMFGLLAMVSLLGPDAVLNRKVEERQTAIQRQLPDMLDLLTISVEAGLGFEQALDRTISSVPGPLSDEFSRMLGEVRAGSSRAEAMRALDTRVDVEEVRSFVLAILQADTFGVSIGRIMRAQADEMRVKRRQRAQERAQKAPVKMLLPMVFCIFPALFVVIIGPAAINLMNNF